MIRDAKFSNDGKYRFYLSRIWDDSLNKVCYICLNPSIADENKDDKTVTMLINITKNNNCGGFFILNLSDYILTNEFEQFALTDEFERIPRPQNPYIDPIIVQSDILCFAYGNVKLKILERFQKRLEFLKMLNQEKYCLGLNKNGSPKHPSRLSNNTVLQLFKI